MTPDDPDHTRRPLHRDDRRFARAVGTDDAVSVAGLATRGGPFAGVRVVRAPVGVRRVDAAEMIVRCGAGTPVDELLVELAGVGQTVNLPAGGTVGGALAVGRSTIDRLGYGPVRDVLLQARYVSATADIVTIGGPTVKNVSGFDLCRLFVGSWGTLGFFAEVTLRTRPLPRASRWYRTDADPFRLLAALYRPAAVLWNGTMTWVHLDGEPADLDEVATRHALTHEHGPPRLPTGGRSSHPPDDLRSVVAEIDGPFVAEIGVGIVHAETKVSAEPPRIDPPIADLHRRIKERFDPAGRLNPGRSPMRSPTVAGPVPP